MITLEWAGIDEVIAALDRFTPETETKIKELYYQAQEGTYQDSQIDVPVNSGDLKGSGDTPSQDNGSTWQYDVSYGGFGGFIYDYSEGDSTTRFTDGGLDADGYAWFQELGTKFMDAQPYLGHNFDYHVDELLADLENIV